MVASRFDGLLKWKKRIQSRTNLNGGELEGIESKLGKILIQSRTNLNGGELERIEAKEKEGQGGRPTTRFGPEVFRVLTTFRGVPLPDP